MKSHLKRIDFPNKNLFHNSFQNTSAIFSRMRNILRGVSLFKYVSCQRKERGNTPITKYFTNIYYWLIYFLLTPLANLLYRVYTTYLLLEVCFKVTIAWGIYTLLLTLFSCYFYYGAIVNHSHVLYVYWQWTWSVLSINSWLTSQQWLRHLGIL